MDIIKFPWEAWEFDDPGKTSTPDLRLRPEWRLMLEKLGVGDDWEIRETPIAGSAFNQLELVSPDKDQAVVTIKPKIGTYPDETGTEATLTLYLSQIGNYDLFADISLNHLDDPALPVFVTYLRGDGFRVPKWIVEYKKDSGANASLLECDPDGDDHRFKASQGSVVNKMSETGDPNGLYGVADSGDYYVDGTTTGLPWAENGMLELRVNPYSSAQASQTYQSFVDTAHRAVRCRTAGTWSAWRTL